ncbi:MAG TPA: M3 family metallopeptidase [Bryobacteraceae bacterium]|nr:M3 family metallopeptidase [Bryobacteraceae bacterium]
MQTETITENPLLTERFPIRFDAVKAELVVPAITLLLEQMKARVADLGRPELPRTYENVLITLDRITEPLDYAMNVVRHLEGVATYPELRTAYNEVLGPVSLFYSSIPLDPNIWAAVKTVAESKQARELSPIDKRFLDKTVSSFRRAGADLDEAGKRQLEALDVELTKITTKFSEHVLDATNAYELLVTEEEKLAGLPDVFRAAAQESAKSKGLSGWRFTLHAPSYTPLMTYLDDRVRRREMWEASNSRATSGELDNRNLILEILRLRREKANLLGYRDFADLVLENRMAHNGTEAQAFVQDLESKTRPFFEREVADIEEFGRKLGYEKLEPWDVTYVSEKQRKALYDFDEEELRPYFQLDRVVAGMFDIFSRVLGIKVIDEPGVPVWDPAVKYYRVIDEASGILLGGFYTDWFPRENKRGGAWMDGIFTGDPDRAEPHLGVIAGNLMPPVGEMPSLLTHREVETIFHEFGHLLHQLVGRVRIKSLASMTVPWDFIELPSQIMENWCMERDALNLFARRYQSGEPIPDELFQKMKRARNFMSATGQMRQLGFALMDLKLHREFDPLSSADVMAFARDILARFAIAPLPPHYGMIASFTHLFSSPVAYGAGYYSYKWAEVLDADAFTRFRREGIFNAETGLEYRRRILERGDSADAAQLYRDFMGRDPDPNALLERLGLLQAA